MTFRVLLHHLQRQQYLPGKKRALAFLFFPQPLWLKIPKKFSLLSLRAALPLETFGDSFLPLEIFFRLFQNILHCKYPESEKI